MIKKNGSIIFLISIILGSFLFPNLLHAKVRNTINFSDNQFVGIANSEIFHSYRSIEGFENSSMDRTELNYQLITGILSNFEFGVDIPVLFFEDGSEGLGDLRLFQHFKFTNEGPGWPNSSGGFELELPTGDENEIPTVTGDFNARLFGSVGSSFGEGRWEWVGNTGIKFFGESDIDERFDYNASVHFQMNDAYKLNLEFNGSSGGIVDDSQMYLSPGLIFHVPSGFNIMASVPVGLTDDSANHRTTVQFSHEF